MIQSLGRVCFSFLKAGSSTYEPLFSPRGREERTLHEKGCLKLPV